MNSHHDVMQQNIQTNEVDLYELFVNVWKEKRLIALITLVVFSGGVIYAFFSTPVYKATTQLQFVNPAKIKRLTQLQLFDDIVQDKLLSEYIRIMKTTSFIGDFVENAAPETSREMYGAGSLDKRIEEAMERLDIIVADAELKARFNAEVTAENLINIFPYTVEMTAPSRQMAESELNRFLELASKSLMRELRERFNVSMLNEIIMTLKRIAMLERELAEARTDEISRLHENHELALKELQDQLDSRKQYVRTRLNDQIREIEEAYSVAEALGITDPVALQQLSKQSDGRVEVFADIRSQEDPLYVRGTRLLGAELKELKSRPSDYMPDDQVRQLEASIASMKHNRQIEMLKARKSDHPFSETIRELKGRLRLLKAEKFPEDISLEFRAAPAFAGPTPVEPKKMQTLILSVVLGGMIGVVAALVRSTVRKREEADNRKSL